MGIILPMSWGCYELIFVKFFKECLTFLIQVFDKISRTLNSNKKDTQNNYITGNLVITAVKKIRGARE